MVTGTALGGFSSCQSKEVLLVCHPKMFIWYVPFKLATIKRKRELLSLRVPPSLIDPVVAARESAGVPPSALQGVP